MKFSLDINGRFACQTKNFASGTTCLYKCRAGWIPGNAKTLTCNEKKNKNDEIISYEWDKRKEDFDCVKSIRY